MINRVENIIETIREMNSEEKLELINQLFGKDLLSDVFEDIEDLLLYISRKNEPGEDFKEFVEELRQEGRLN
ncbi:hypothetical protein ACFLQJ_02490 [Calditrichota bacterium]